MSHSESFQPQVLAPAGRLDAAAAPGLRQQIVNLLARQTNYIIVNLASVPYLSSSTLRVLLACHKSARRAGGDLVLCCTQPQVLRVIKMVGFDRILAIYDTQEQAVQALMLLVEGGVAGGEKQ